MTALFRSFLEKLQNGTSTPEEFAAEVQADWFPDEVKEAQRHTQHLGPMKSVDRLEREKHGDQQEYTYRGTFNDNKKIVYCFTLNSESKVVGFRPCKN